jgi:hypothetical protein
MSDYELEDWADVVDDQEWPLLLLGNGASRAVSDKFAYHSLYLQAPLSDEDRELFEALGTTNFEEVLNHLRTAELVCDQLGHASNEVSDRYSSIQEALIQVVNDHHVAWEDAQAGDCLSHIRSALREHAEVFTTSYDLLIYWAMMSGAPPGDGFGDLFWNAGHKFDPLNTDVNNDKTIVYWLHGGLHLQRGTFGDTIKRTNQGENLLTTFAAGSNVPLFITEGTWKKKRGAIRRSDYLEYSYRTFAGSTEALVVFGQALGGADHHLVRAITQAPGREVAYSVYPGTRAQTNHRCAGIEVLLPNASVRFFDSTTHPLGDPALKVP